MKPLTYLKSVALFLALLVLSLPFAFAGEQNLVYDGVGNLISGDGFIREYNGFNQLVRIKNESGGILEDFIWHPIEERVFIKKIYNSSGEVATRITYLNENSVKVKNSSGTFYETYVYQDGVLVAQKDTNGNKQAVHNDNINSVSLITDSAGNVLENEFYSPYGEIIEGGSGSRYTYTGQEKDEFTDEYDYGDRMYKSQWGILLQGDSIIKDIYNPKDLNHYAYARHNPFKYIDPNGKEVAVALRDTNIVPLGIGEKGIDTGHIGVVVRDPDQGNFRYYSNEGLREKADLPEWALQTLAIATPLLEATYNTRQGSTIEGTLPEKGSGLEYRDYFIIETTPEQDRMVIDRAEEIVADPQIYNVLYKNSEDFAIEILNEGGIDYQESSFLPIKNYERNKDAFTNQPPVILDIVARVSKDTKGPKAGSSEASFRKRMGQFWKDYWSKRKSSSTSKS